MCVREREKKKSQTICESKQIMTLGCLHIELGGTLGFRREEGNGGKRELAGCVGVRLSICLSVSFEINLLLTLLINAGSFAV